MFVQLRAQPINNMPMRIYLSRLIREFFSQPPQGGAEKSLMLAAVSALEKVLVKRRNSLAFVYYNILEEEILMSEYRHDFPKRLFTSSWFFVSPSFS